MLCIIHPFFLFLTVVRIISFALRSCIMYPHEHLFTEVNQKIATAWSKKDFTTKLHRAVLRCFSEKLYNIAHFWVVTSAEPRIVRPEKHLRSGFFWIQLKDERWWLFSQKASSCIFNRVMNTFLLCFWNGNLLISGMKMVYFPSSRNSQNMFP